MLQIKSCIFRAVSLQRVCNKLTGPISAALHLGNTALSEEMLQRWRAVGNSLSDLTGPRFEPQTSHSIDKRVTAQPTGRSFYESVSKTKRIVNAKLDSPMTSLKNDIIS